MGGGVSQSQRGDLQEPLCPRLFVNLPYHGIERQVFLSPLASNARELLRGETGVPQWCRAPMKELGEFLKERWMLPLPSWDQRYRDFDPGRLRLWEKE